MTTRCSVSRYAPSILATAFFVTLFLTAGQVAAQDVAPVELSSISPADFSDDELDLPYYLAHFHTLVNSVRMTEPNRGFIDLPVWRETQHQEPYNARVMENILSIAFFYTTDRPWNPYFADAAVRARLEAALEYWVEMQSEDGCFSTYGPQRWLLSPTSFATKFIGEAIQLLHDGPQIDPGLMERVVEAQRRAIVAVLTREDFYNFGQRFSNQFTNVWGGALAYLDLYPDPDIRRLLEARLVETDDDFQSPAGYFYEHDGADFSYDIETHHSNHLMAWHFLRDEEWGDFYAARVRRWYDWLAYNAALEPDGSGFTMNYQIATRLHFPFYRDDRETAHGRTCSPLAEVIVMARAFCETKDERNARLEDRRRDLERSWPDVAPLEIGAFSSYSPYAFLHRRHVRWHPTDAQRDEAVEMLPYLTGRHFNHQRADNQREFVLTYVRRRPYYAAFSAGEQIIPQQRFGLGFVWTPETGTLLQGQLEGSAWGDDEAERTDAGLAWGTRPYESADVYETEILDVRYELNGGTLSVEQQPQDVRTAPIKITYSLGERGRKTLTFRDDEIHVAVQHTGPFVETLPLLLRSGTSVDIEGSTAILGGEATRIVFDSDAEPTTIPTGRPIGPKRVHLLQLRDSGSLTYRIQL